MADIEVYILNFNGSHHLKKCLTSISNCDHGEHLINVSVVDNGSTDKSEIVVKDTFPKINFIKLDKNYGFSQGNNLGVKQRKIHLGKNPDFHVFLNNDTQVDKNWLIKGIEPFLSDPQIGIVGTKSLFMDKFAMVEFTDNTTSKIPIVKLNSISLEKNVAIDTKRYKATDFIPENSISKSFFNGGKLLVPVNDISLDLKCTLNLEVLTDNQISISKVDTLNNKVTEIINLKKNSVYNYNLSVAPQDFCTVIQNAGSFVNSELSGGDRGTGLLANYAYTTPQEVSSICGVSMFICDKAFTVLNGFDPNYFAYYEDTDLSLRARVAGYKLWYQPESIIYHLHAGSGGEYSEYFNVNVSFSHLLFSSKFMNDYKWQEKLASIKTGARQEFRNYELDRDLTGKYNLRSYTRYLKKWLTFRKNRQYAGQIYKNNIVLYDT
jgi:GT2 family glycosyltransferase